MSGDKRVYRVSPGEVVAQPRKEPFRVSGPPVYVWLLSPSIETIVAHHVDGRTGPCFARIRKEDCAHCMKGRRRQLQSWIFCKGVERGSEPSLLHLTPCAVGAEPKLEEWAGFLTGCKLKLWRSPEQPRGRMYAELVEGAELHAVPSVPDVFETLCRMWNGKIRKVNFTPQSPEDELEYNAPPVAGKWDERIIANLSPEAVKWLGELDARPEAPKGGV